MVISTITLLSTIYKRTTESTGTLPSALPTVQITINDSIWKAGLLMSNKCHSTVYYYYLHHTNDLLTTSTKQTNNRHFTNNRLTKYGSKRTNHLLQSSQPITSRLTDKRPITSWLRWPIRLTTRDIYTIYWRSTIHLTLKMTSAQVVETSVKVTSNSPSQDYTHPDDHNLPTYDMTPGFKPFTIILKLRRSWQKLLNEYKFKDPWKADSIEIYSKS